jgi:mRNA interferase RelE/StbE
MKVEFRKSFLRDVKKIKDQRMRDQIQDAIVQVESANGPSDLGDLKKLAGSKNCYRIRVGDYRLGVMIERDTLIFARCLDRREVYRHFP